MSAVQRAVAPRRRVTSDEFVLALLRQLPRDVVEIVIECAIGHLDGLDGDLDVEGNGDEFDTMNAEDEGYAPPIWLLRSGRYDLVCEMPLFRSATSARA